MGAGASGFGGAAGCALGASFTSGCEGASVVPAVAVDAAGRRASRSRAAFASCLRASSARVACFSSSNFWRT